MNIFKTFYELFSLTLKVFIGEIDYNTYSVEVRKPEYFFPQAIMLFLFLTIGVIVTGFPLVGYIVLMYALLTMLAMTRKAYTIKKQFLMGILWAVQAFIVSIIIMVIAVYLNMI